MGVPALFRWLSQKYPKIISPVIEAQSQEIDGQEIPVDISGPNPNGEEMDNLYLDMNGIVHPCSHPEDRPPPATEEEMMLEIFKYTDRVINMVRPRKILMIAVDGVAPRAKMNQQRSRRFRSAKEAKEKDESKEEFLKMLKSKNGSSVGDDTTEPENKKTWDSNAITPGTPFMDILASSLRYWTAYKLNTDPAWAKVKVIISDATVPGEGEHKIMEFIRSQRSSPEHDPNTRHVIYGLDADLIMLGLATHEPHFRVLREDVFFQESKARTCRICGQKGHKAEECRGEAKQKDGEFDEKDKAHPLKPFIWLHVAVLREYLQAELHVPQQPFRFDLERALDDWVFMCFFVGNDFLPHLPSLDIRENGIDTLIAIWRDNLPAMGGYVTKDGHVDLERAQFILSGLARQEDAIFRRRRQTEERKERNAKRRKLEEQRNNSHRKSDNGSSLAPRGRRGSPDYGTPTNRRSSGALVNPTVAPDIPLFTPGKGDISKEERIVTHDMAVNRGAIYKANMANKSAALALKSQLLGKGSPGAASNGEGDEMGKTDADVTSDLANGEASSTDTPSSLGKRKAELMQDDDAGTPGRQSPNPGNATKPDSDDLPPDTVRLWEDGYADRYYEQKFGVDPKNIGFRNKVARAYVEGLAWVLLYYFQGCPSWTWYYPYHYAPFAADFVDIDKMKISFERGTPFKPFEQLMGVLPAASNHAIPPVFRDLMTDEDSDIIDFYPEEFPVDLNGKKFAWQGVALLPFIDEKRLLKAMATKYPLLSAEDAARNAMGKDVLLISERHPLYEDIAKNFYSKKQGAPKYKLDSKISEGLAGKIEKNDAYLPQSSLTFPLPNGGMPDLEDDHSISVHYEMPHSSHVHKSMLLRGLKMPSPKLDRADIEGTKGRAGRSGRSFGGAPLRDYGERNDQNRGPPVNYSDSRANPFAAHLNPSFNPQGFNGNQLIPPPPGALATPGWVPPMPDPNSFWRGPPPPPPGQGFQYGYGGPPPPPPTQRDSGKTADKLGQIKLQIASRVSSGHHALKEGLEPWVVQMRSKAAADGVQLILWGDFSGALVEGEVTFAASKVGILILFMTWISIFITALQDTGRICDHAFLFSKLTALLVDDGFNE
ncbi:MAG: 5'-3' exoribonuclease 2 [Sarea resinae]|nr:MAG: 5'-3' exoribonuclease 2 [Sarea resinae]